MAWMRYTDGSCGGDKSAIVRSLRERAEDKGEERRGGSLDEERRTGDRVPKKIKE